MWQQLDCTAAAGCQNDLFPWVEATVGAGSNGKPPPAGFTYKEGATSMGFYNVQQGDAPYLKTLADTYSMSDNYHQAVTAGPAPTTSCSAPATRSGSATATAIR